MPADSSDWLQGLGDTRGAHAILLCLMLAVPCPSGRLRAADLLDLPFADLLQVEVAAAGKREAQIRDIPASVTILTREELARYGYATLEDLLRNVPGFFILDNTEERFIGNRGTVGGGVQFLVNGISQHPSRQKVLTVPQIARLNIPVESIDRIEVIRGPMSVIYGNNAFLGVVNIVTNSLDTAGPRLSASAGSRASGQAFARLGGRSRDGFLVLNAGGWRTDGLDATYADIMSSAQFATLEPEMHRDLDGDLWQRRASLDLSAGWRGLTADMRYSDMDYGIYAFTPAFDEGSGLRLKTLHAALGYEHRFSDTLGLRLVGIHSQETYDAYRLDFLVAGLDGSQKQHLRRWELELELNLHWQPWERLDALFGYRWHRLDHLDNRPRVASLVMVDDASDAFHQQDIFTEIDYSLGEPLRLVGGARLTRLPAAYRFTRYRYQDETLIETELPVSDRNDDLRSDLEPGYSPTLLVKLKADYRRGPLTYAAYAHYVDAMEADWDFVTSPAQGVVERIGERVPGRWNLGLNLRWEPSATGVFAALNVSNLLDAEIRYPANELADFARGLIGPGRIVTATLGYAF